jgi:SecD/SecF fusion protein
MNPNLCPILLAANKYRIIDFDFPRILPHSLDWPSKPLIVLLLIIVSFVVGAMFANAVRMRDYGWKVGLILSTMLVSTFIVLFGDFKLGVDLKGGVILVYEVNERETESLRRGSNQSDWEMSQLLAVITRRLNPTGLKEIVVRPFGPKQVEVVVPEVDPQEIELIKETIRTGGVLQFMIVASTDRDPAELFDAARQQAEKGEDRLQRSVIDPDTRKEVTGDVRKERQIGYWARLAHEEGDEATAPLRATETIANGFVRNGRTGEILDWTPQQKQLFASSPLALQAYMKEHGIPYIDVLMIYDQDFAIKGDDLNPGLTYAGHDESFRPAIHFAMRAEGSHKMGYVTQEHIERKLAIIFDNELLSAPVIRSKITDSGQITGNFTQEEVDFIVGILKSGSMPVVMQKEPISENQIGAILGMDTIVKGSWSVVVSLAMVLAFTFLYYRFAGFVACCALILNLLLTLAIMILIQAPLTLPGLAGLVLTVGMSVDSNVLIFERMREELSRGAALRMAIRNGFDRAMVTIIDSNLTTLLTAFVLYFIGTDQVKGFGITLILGILTSMYTAIFCARVVFEIGERTRWLKTLRMTHFLTNPNVDWVKLFAPATIASIVVICIGLVATVARGTGLFDIDLAGGTSVTFILNEPMPVAEVRAKLDAVLPKVTDPETKTLAQFTAYELSLSGGRELPQTVFKVDSSLKDVELLKTKVREALRTPDGRDLLKTYQVELGKLEEVPLEPPPISPSLSAPGKAPPATPKGIAPAVPSKAATEAAPPASKSTPAATEKAAEPAVPSTESAPKTEAKSGCGDVDEAQPEAAAAAAKSATAEPKADDAPPAAAKSDAPAARPPVAPPAATTPSADQPAVEPAAVKKVKTTATLRFPSSPISAASLTGRIQSSAKTVLNQNLTDVHVDNPKWDRQDNSTFDEWKVTLPVDATQASAILTHLRKDLSESVVWQTSSQIGGQVSADTRMRAFGAIVVSMLGIVAYMWFRFQKAVWGIAAVVAVAHDTLIMLGGIAISYWLVGLLGFAGIEQFKISLPVIAAFLTLIGYSVNDTIVIFDRVREIRGKSPNLTRQMLNDAVNLTMSRTILTSGTVFIVVVVLYFFGGPGIHAFAFSLVIGVISGTYSTVFIAAPLLLWMFNREQTAASPKLESRDVKKSVA